MFFGLLIVCLFACLFHVLVESSPFISVLLSMSMSPFIHHIHPCVHPSFYPYPCLPLCQPGLCHKFESLRGGHFDGNFDASLIGEKTDRSISQ